MTAHAPRLACQPAQSPRLSRALEVGRTRIIVAGAVFAAAFFAIALRLTELSLLQEGIEPRRVAATGTQLHTERADILDRNGTMLATSLTTASLYADPSMVLDPAGAAAKLVRELPSLSEAQLRAKLQSDRRFVWLHRNLTPRQQYAINALGIPGLEFQREERRVYPLGQLGSHVLGMTDVDNKGLAGIERTFDQTLRTGAGPLHLSIDARAQHILDEELRRASDEFQAIGAAGVVLDVQNGEVLAMASLPEYDPNRPSAVSDDHLFNRATLGVYEMGSTFKIFNTALALDSGVVKMSGGFDATHPIRIARFTIRDYHAKRRWLSVPEIFMYSSNIGSAKMALAVGGDAQREFLGKLGLLRKAPIELPEVGQPLSPARWREINTMTIAFGHGISVSAVQLAAAVGAMVNGGVLYPPTLIRQTAPPKGQRVISAATSAKIRKLMRLVVENGTGRNASAEGYLVGGKTGTAEKAAARGYKRGALLSSFVGAFPMTAPRYVVLAALDEPQGNRRTFGYATGGWVAAPVVRAVIARLGAVLAIPPVDEQAPEIEREMQVQLNSREATKRIAAH